MKKRKYLTVAIISLLFIFAAYDIFDHDSLVNFIIKHTYLSVFCFSILAFGLTLPSIKDLGNVMTEQQQKEQELLENGRKVLAKIIKVEETGLSIGDDPKLRITAAVGTELLITFEDFVPFFKQGLVKPGEMVEIIYDPENTSEAVCRF